MSREFHIAMYAVLVSGLAFFVWLHFAEIALIDELIRLAASAVMA